MRKARLKYWRGDAGRAQAALAAALFFFAAALFAAVAAHAFQSVGIQNVQAGCLTGGVRPQFLKIHQTQVTGWSDITKDVVIIGEAGFETPVPPPPYNQRLTTFSQAPAPENRQVEVLVEYGFAPTAADDPQNPIQTSSIVGPDPMSFAFSLNLSNPLNAVTGVLKYRVLARRLVNGTTTYQSDPSDLPPNAPGNPTNQARHRWVTANGTSNALQVFGAEGGRLTLPNGNPTVGQSYIDVPRGMFSQPTAVTFDEVPLNAPNVPPGLTNVIKLFQLDSQFTLHGNMMMTLLYPDFQYPAGQDGIVDGTQIPESSLGISYWDGFTWKYLGGITNPQLNTVTARVGGPGFYAIVPAQAQAPQDARPMQKIITPNGDGKNDVALFTFANPLDNIKVEIFDMTGHRMRTLFSANDNGWDGRDDSGSIVESGVYIYQYRLDGKLVSGLIAVAK